MASRYLIVPETLAGQDLGFALAAEGLLFRTDVAEYVLFATTPPRQLAPGLLVIGQYFSKNAPYTRHSPVNGNIGVAGLDNQCATLLSTGWGAYVAVVTDTRHRVAVLRDPSGAMPCLYAALQGARVFASDLDLLLRVGLVSLSIDWMQLAQSLWNDQICSRETCIRDVNELRPGEKAIVHGNDVSLDFAWDPRPFASQPRTGSESDLAEGLYTCVTQTVKSLVGGLEHVTLNLSGGLDSSILASCLGKSGVDLTCLTMIGPDAKGNERQYVQALQQKLGLKVQERAFDTADVDVERPIAPHLPRPRTAFFLQCLDAAYKEVVGHRPAGAHLNGNGGDNVFSYLQTAAPIADRILVEGLSPGAFSTLLDMCRLSGSDIRTAIAKTRKGLVQRSHPFVWNGDSRHLTAAAIESLPAFDHPWLHYRQDVLPGKRTQISYLLRAQNFLEGGVRRSSAPDISPLLAQPIMEFCLSVPSWYWCRHGLNRSLARQAFSADLPVSVVHRRSKGSPGGFLHQLYRENQKRVREIVLSGRLCAEGILNRQSLANELSLPSIRPDLNYMRLLELTAVETWVQHWSSASLSHLAGSSHRTNQSIVLP